MRHQESTPGRAIARILFVATLTIAVIGAARDGRGQYPDRPAVAVGGHFDVQVVVPDNTLSDHDFQIGQLGITVASEFNRKVKASLEVAYDRDDQIVVDEAFIDYTFFHRQRRFIRARTAGLMRVALRVGRFDVPFGVDWRDYSSWDRPLITMPLVVLNTHRGWNDVGALFFGSTTWSKWAVWVVNDFGQSPGLRLDERRRVPSDLGSIASRMPAVDAADHPIKDAFGLRAAIVISEVFEIGTSFGAGYTKRNVQDEKLIGFDFTAAYEGFEFVTEFIRQERFRTTDQEEIVFGYFMRALYGSDRFFAVFRQEAYDADGSEVYPLGTAGSGAIFCASLGAGFKATPQAQIRVEYRMCEGPHNDVAVLQAVVGF